MASLNDSVIEYKKQLEKGADSIIEYTLSEKPDVDDHVALTRQIKSGTLKFTRDIKELIKDI
jgi:hypothetical protein